MKMSKSYSWLQISDLHIFESTDWNIMLNAYRDLSKVIKPDFLVVTGDFCHQKKHPSYDNALDFLNQVVIMFNLKKEDVFLVPGNHDAKSFEMRKEIITTIRTNVETDADVYTQYMNGGTSDLRQSFIEYSKFVCDFYNGEVNDDRVKKPSDVICVNWRNRLNIVILNTALISDGDISKKGIVDIREFSKLEPIKLQPTIVLAHHDINSLTESHSIRVETILNKINASVYLCGDKHKIAKKGIGKYNVPNTTIPMIVCGKSAIQTGDDFSDLCVIQYKSNDTKEVFVQVYRYEKTGFKESNDFYYDVNKKFSFPMIIEENPKSVTKRGVKRIENERTPLSIWLPDAELAKGRQTRFNSFTTTDVINKYFDSESGYLGIVSVKGIGKTFLLQVKRIKSARKYYCLPRCSKPSIKNNWATERISFDSYRKLKTENIYDDLVVLWKFAIKCYVINSLKNDENVKTINEYAEYKKINNEVASLCLDENNDSLEAIMSNIVNFDRWNEKITQYTTNISNLCRIVLRRRKNKRSIVKDIAIFIDKVDQAIKQTNAEPPADCVVCKKKNYYNECKSKRKSTSYCSEDSGCQSKNCCYGCELFAGERSNDGLRIYEKSNVSKLIHVNIWQYLQLALMSAAGQIFDEFNGQINVFYTIRQEAFSCEENRLGEQNQKIAGKIVNLSYSVEEHKKIFLDCIRAQDDYYLFKPEFKDENGLEEYAFVGVNNLCHPYCLNSDGSHQNESVFMSIYRHSFDRSRDIQRYGEKLTQNIDRIKRCKDAHDREEIVKQIIEEEASVLAYCSKQSESTVNPSYYTEKMHYLPNYWADNDNFENLLSLIDRNLLFEDDIKCICKKINGYETCPNKGCQSEKCKRHPFSMLYNMGYLGYIVSNSNNDNCEPQQFLNASEVSYFIESDDLMTADRVAYIIHPALTKVIEKKFNKSFMHFSGFILGKGLSVESEIISKMVEDRKKLDNDAFLSKYYYKP